MPEDFGYRVSMPDFQNQGTRVPVQIVILNDESGESIADLHSWLRDDEETRLLQISMERAPAKPGDMTGGGLAQALEATVSSKEAIAGLAGVIGGWLSSRAATRRTKIRVKTVDVEIEIDTAKVKESEEIARRIVNELSRDK